MSFKSHSIESIGRQLREKRLAAGLSQNETAVAAGVGRSTLIHLEQGRKDVRLSNVLSVAGAIGASLGLEPAAPGQGPRRLARAEQALKAASRRHAHMRLAVGLILGDPKALRAHRDALDMVALWKKERTCSDHYVKAWTRILAGTPAQAAKRMHGIDPDWLEALLQNTPFSRALALA